MKLFESMSKFNYYTRYLPISIAAIPIFIIGLLKGILSQSLLDGGMYTFVIFPLVIFGGNISRNHGKNVEQKMYNRLKFKPTTIVLSYADERIDELTKDRYHQKLKSLLPDLDIPLSRSEETPESMKCYASSINYIRNYVKANTTEFALVHEDLIKYNLWRNLYGIRYYIYSIYVLLMTREAYLLRNSSIETFIHPSVETITFYILFISLLIFIITLTRRNVETRAFEYAITLVECCEHIHPTDNSML